eukprot:TRINITY_DN58252_c0_g1_i1.p2 TRINITY_DN58252_c0_g1~~TRINITY_DN58252_c0_g1_i1.p2  ORF type:complete len:110 (+),score=6.68 TRINITY_DN58252_c0_g1_i1:185-514(+)
MVYYIAPVILLFGAALGLSRMYVKASDRIMGDARAGTQIAQNSVYSADQLRDHIRSSYPDSQELRQALDDLIREGKPMNVTVPSDRAPIYLSGSRTGSFYNLSISSQCL